MASIRRFITIGSELSMYTSITPRKTMWRVLACGPFARAGSSAPLFGLVAALRCLPRGVLLSVAGGSDLGLFEINEAASLVQDAAHQDANIIFGTVIDDSLGDEVRVTVIAAGFDAAGPGRKPVVSNATAAATTTVASGKHGKISSSLFEPADAVSVSVPTNGATFDIGGEDDDVDVPPFMRR